MYIYIYKPIYIYQFICISIPRLSRAARKIEREGELPRTT